ncbi:hypothetical protein HYH39_16145 [Clostridium botulinum]|uniref:hypothetical protein n=1 Tax=unclassified Clostridium TaxID=2614128 RepID=UPI000A40F1D8|nr:MULTISPECIES: hypothetical protein [unclassified Clostridium]MBY6780411.1 hypothetical protein [Clostridium botulinum]MBY6853640.1 hypothetical protein [Clostridium botulinum]MBY7009212.1 hypothetical protein [Clostridium botulinum]
MRELEIREQKSICGGTQYDFTDLTTGYSYHDTDKNALKSKWYALKSQGHKVSRIIHN